MKKIFSKLQDVSSQIFQINNKNKD